MRLIDADALAKKLFLDDEYQNCTDDYNEGIKDAIKAVNNAPTVESVKRGHWKRYKCRYDGKYYDPRTDYNMETYECSKCGRVQLMAHPLRFGYCPERGAKMDEVSK